MNKKNNLGDNKQKRLKIKNYNKRQRNINMIIGS